MLGKHILIDVSNIEEVEKIEKCEGLYELMNEIIQVLKLNVVNYMCHNFTPYGCSMLYLLSESHLSIHTYPENSSVSLDLYTCSLDTNLLETCEIIYQFFGGKSKIKYQLINR